MSLAEIRNLYTYTDWANEHMLNAIRALSGEQYSRELKSSFPTIRDTMGHIASAEWIWLQRWNGTSPTAAPPWSAVPSVETLEENVRAVSVERREFLSTLDESALERPLSYRTLKGDAFTNRFGDVLFHVVNHSTYHRGQLTTMLREVGAVPPATDLIVFARERQAR